MVTMEDDITQPSATTEVSMEVLPRPIIQKSTRNKSRSNFQRLFNNNVVYAETII